LDGPNARSTPEREFSAEIDCTGRVRQARAKPLEFGRILFAGLEEIFIAEDVEKITAFVRGSPGRCRSGESGEGIKRRLG
jgi:hypothetical protein